MIKYDIKNQTAIITLNRPEKRNALNSELVTRLSEKISEAESNVTVKSVILTGEGKAFCAGADLEYLNLIKNNSPVENEKDSASLADMYLRIYNCSKPTIAAVNGPAIAGGCGLASVCDFVFADSQFSKFGYTEVRIGFVPAIVSIFLIKKIGEGKAKQLLLSGEIINADSAHKIGMVDFLSDNVLNDALNFAEKLNLNSLESLMMSKKMLHSISGLNVTEAVEYCLRINILSRSTKDFEEGINKFLNK